MIFVTVGTQYPFDRLVRAVDAWAVARNRTDIVAQIGSSQFSSQNMTTHADIGTVQFRQYVENCQILIAHAGMGSILTALELGKPILVMPRRAELGEHRNNHQLATVEGLAHISAVNVVNGEDMIAHRIDRLLSEAPSQSCGSPRSAYASPELLHTVRHFVRGFSKEQTNAVK